MKFFTRADIWAKIVKTIQLVASIFQFGTLGASELGDKVVTLETNFWVAVAQGVVSVISYWTVDENRDNIIDIAQDPIQTTVKLESTGPVTVKEVTTEKKEDAGNIP